MLCVSCTGAPRVGDASADPQFDWFVYEGRDPVYNELAAAAGQYKNPILAGFHPDPSIVRVGDDYYLVNSSFAYFPGIPVFHSRDLVNWTQIGHAIERPSQMRFDSLEISDGIFAPAIEYHDGTFYLITTFVRGGGNFLVTATTPAGPWSDPAYLPSVDGIDPSLFFDDDGRAYVVNNGPPIGTPLYDGHRALWIQEYDVVARAMKGPRKLIVNGGVDLSKKPIWIEGPHILKVDGRYYLIAAEGGTAEEHSEVVFRSDSVFGPYVPYEGNPILTQRHLDPKRAHPITSTGHADFVSTPDGEWWAVFLGARPYEDDHYNTGRETFLLPVRWTDGWPVILNGDSVVPYVHKRPALAAQPAASPPTSGNFTVRDDFDAPELARYWNFIRTPNERWYELNGGALTLRARPDSIGGRGQPSFVGRRQQHAFASASVAMRYHPLSPGDRAGLVAFQNDRFNYALTITRTGVRTFVQLEKRAGGARDDGVIASAPVELPTDGTIHLRIDARGALYDFSYALSPDAWVALARDVDGTVLSTRRAQGFVGAYFGMYAYSAAPGSAADSEELRLARVFGDGMVLQRDAPIRVWGWARPGETVTARLAERTARGQSDREGRWQIEIPARPAGGPAQLTVTSAGSQVVVNDIVFGDVWVASGQSNMEWTVAASNDATNEIASARDSLIRQFKVPHAWSWTPEVDLTGGAWSPADPEHAGAFSAVGYFFARELRKATGVPIGLINTTWSGSGIAAWLSRSASALSDSAWSAVMRAEDDHRREVRETLRARLGTLPEVDSGLIEGRAHWADPALDDAGWSSIAVPGLWERAGFAGLDGIAWYRTTFTLSEAEARAGARLTLGTVDDDDITWVNSIEVGRTSGYSVPRLYDVPAAALRAGRNVLAVRVADGGGGGGIVGTANRVFVEIGGARRPLNADWKFRVGAVSLGEDGQRINKIPTVLYNRMVHPLLPFPIRGVIWYQGESNANNDEQAAAYREQFATLIRSWRGEWSSSVRDFPFLWVQLPNFGAPDTTPPAHAAWAVLRESQTAALALPNTGQAVAIDVGDAADLHPRNKQDVGRRLALAAQNVAHGTDVAWSGPVYLRHHVRERRVVIEFEHAEGGLVSRAPGEQVGGFAIAGADRQFVWAQARIDGDRVVVWNEAVPDPVAVRYAWGNSPAGLSLYNHAGLPASPFRTDDW